MSTVLWRTWLNASLEANTILPAAHFMQLATLKLNGRPSNRTVLFRGFVENSNKMTICTDQRSAKTAEIRNIPHGSVCWYFSESREQFRFDVDMECISSDTEDPHHKKIFQQIWGSLSEHIKRSFSGVAPGQPLTPTTEHDVSEELLKKRCCVVVMKPLHVDYYDCKADRRFIHSLKDGDWTVTEVHI